MNVKRKIKVPLLLSVWQSYLQHIQNQMTLSPPFSVHKTDKSLTYV